MPQLAARHSRPPQPHRHAQSIEFSAAMDDAIVSLAKSRMSQTKIAAAIGRGERSVRRRIEHLRELGRFGALRDPAKNEMQALRQYQTCDAALADACNREGGFPRAYVLDGKTFWITPEGGAWRHIPQQPARFRRAA